MSATADHLRELHQLLLQLEEIRDKIARGPRVVAVHQRKVHARESELDTQRETLADLRRIGNAKSGDLKSNEAKILTLRAKLNQVTTNREFDIVKGQIEADEMANSVLEDEILETFEKIDVTEAEIIATETRLTEDRAQTAAAAERVAGAEEGLRREEAGLQAAVAKSEQKLPETLVEKYRRLVGAHGAGALAPLEGAVCSACYVELETQLRVEIKSGKAVFCRSCGRLMYRGAEEG